MSTPFTTAKTKQIMKNCKENKINCFAVDNNVFVGRLSYAECAYSDLVNQGVEDNTFGSWFAFVVKNYRQITE